MQHKKILTLFPSLKYTDLKCLDESESGSQQDRQKTLQRFFW